MDPSTLGKGIMVAGVVLLLTGALIWLLGRTGLPLGQLRGDIHLQGENLSCYIPLASMLLVSIVLTILLNLAIRFLNR